VDNGRRAVLPYTSLKLPVTTVEDLVDGARRALGGLERLRGVRSYYAEMLRSYADGASSHVTVWRAVPGRIFIEERTSDGHVGRRSTAGPLTDDERADLLRTARLSPRNLLAHADEIELRMRDHLAPGGLHVVSFPAEFAIYFFDAVRHTCLLTIDLARGRRTAYGDYRDVDGILTPFHERHQGDGRAACFDDRLIAVSYNLAPPDDLWTEPRP